MRRVGVTECPKKMLSHFVSHLVFCCPPHCVFCCVSHFVYAVVFHFVSRTALYDFIWSSYSFETVACLGRVILPVSHNLCPAVFQCALGPRDPILFLPLLSHLSPTVSPYALGALGRMILHLSPPLDSVLRMMLHLSPTCLPIPTFLQPVCHLSLLWPTGQCRV